MTSDHPRHEQVLHATAVIDADAEPQPIPVNMYEAGEALVVVAPLPAVMPADVILTVSTGQLSIRAHLRSAAPKDYLLHEWRYGGYERTVALPPGFGSDAEASLANGQLAVRLLRGEPDEPYAIHPTSPLP